MKSKHIGSTLNSLFAELGEEINIITQDDLKKPHVWMTEDYIYDDGEFYWDTFCIHCNKYRDWSKSEEEEWLCEGDL